jgi:sulfite exporter TauE/SafE
MLASITPLGERARGSRWGLTVAFYVASATLAGAAAGALAGALGSLVWQGDEALDVRAAVLAGALVVGFALDLGGRLPTLRRQVNEDWLREYRGWVYGAGFGGQLGLGVTTIVTTSLVYVTLLAAFLSGGLARGAAVGAAFGLARGATLLAGARVTQPSDLTRLHRRIDRWRVPVRAGTLAAQVLLAAALALGAGA